MSQTIYIKDTKRFWQERKQARAALDKKRANAPYTEKVKVIENLRSDIDSLRRDRVVSSK